MHENKRMCINQTSTYNLGFLPVQDIVYVFILSMQIRFTVTVPFQIRIKLINTETVGRTWDSP